MNVSGKPAQKAFDILKIPSLENCLFVQDDLENVVGQCKIKEGGSAEGHNGIKSIIQHFNTNNFRRLKIGIGRPTSHDPAVISNYVLGPFDNESSVVSSPDIKRRGKINETSGLGKSNDMQRSSSGIPIIRGYSVVGSYNPLRWPAEIRVARNHEKASSIGVDKNDGSRCICCAREINKEKYDFLRTDVAKELSFDHGTAVGGCFNMIKYYIGTMIMMSLSTSLFFIFLWNHVCNGAEQKGITYGKNKSPICVDYWSTFYFTGSDQIIYYLKETGEQLRLKFWRWILLVNFIIIIMAQFFVDFFFEKLQRTYGKRKTPLASQSLLINYIPYNMKEDELVDYLQRLMARKKLGSFEVKQLLYLQNYAQYYEHFNLRTNVYYQMRPLLSRRKELDPKELKAKGDLFVQIVREDKEVKKYEQQGFKFGGKALITLQSHYQALQMRKAFKKGIWFHVRLFSFKLFAKIGICRSYFFNKIQEERQIYGNWAPEPVDIKWENIGMNSTEKMGIIWLAYTFTVISVVVCTVLLVLVQLLKFQFAIIIGAVVIVQVYAILIQIIAVQRQGQTHSSKSYFILSKNSFFHLLFLILVPTLFYIFDDDFQPQRAKNLFLMVIVFNLIIIFFTFLNIPLILQENQKSNILKFKQWNQYCQQELNRIFQKMEFPIEMVFLNVSKLWSFAALQAFTCPFTVIICALFLFIYYWIIQYQLLNYFTIIEFKSVGIQKRYLRWYSIFFQFFILVLFGAVIDYNQTQFIIGAIFYALLVAFELYQIRNPLFQHQTQSKIEQGMLDHSKNTDVDNEWTYQHYYDIFKESLKNYDLEHHINNVVTCTQDEADFDQDKLSPKDTLNQ